MNNNLKFIFLFLTLGLLMTSCKKDETTFGDLSGETRGTIINFTDSAPGFFNLSDATNSTNSFSFFNAPLGESVNAATLTISFNGSDFVPVEGVTVDGSYTISLTQAAQLTGVDVSTLMAGDVFTVGMNMSTASGDFTNTKTMDIAVSCLSEIAGTYTVSTTGTSTDVCCPDETTVMGTVTLTAATAGVYDISDWSGGLYLEWYDIYGIVADSNTGQIQDICNGITLIDETEPFGETLEGTGSRDPATGVITYTWLTGYGDTGTVTMTPQ